MIAHARLTQTVRACHWGRFAHSLVASAPMHLLRRTSCERHPRRVHAPATPARPLRMLPETALMNAGAGSARKMMQDAVCRHADSSDIYVLIYPWPSAQPHCPAHVRPPAHLGAHLCKCVGQVDGHGGLANAALAGRHGYDVLDLPARDASWGHGSTRPPWPSCCMLCVTCDSLSVCVAYGRANATKANAHSRNSVMGCKTLATPPPRLAAAFLWATVPAHLG